MTEELTQETLDNICSYAKLVSPNDNGFIRDKAVRCLNEKLNKGYYKYCIVSKLFSTGHVKYDVFNDTTEFSSCKYCKNNSNDLEMKI